jgi:hypothetical protein
MAVLFSDKDVKELLTKLETVRECKFGGMIVVSCSSISSREHVLVGNDAKTTTGGGREFPNSA